MLPTRWSDLSMTSPFDRLLRFRREIDHMLDRAYANDWGNDLHPEGEPIWSFPMDLVEAVCENGLLTVTVPKSQEGRPRRIAIGSSGGARRIAKESAA